ncbi:MAG: hypothetical protein IIZ78_07015 [Clostridiales bacterium]|nr:hypothetical protein [Clostridiales bacterium]
MMGEMAVVRKSEVITEETINNAALSVIEELTSCLYELTDDNDDHMRIMTLGEIAGVMDMVRELKRKLGFVGEQTK